MPHIFHCTLHRCRCSTLRQNNAFVWSSEFFKLKSLVHFHAVIRPCRWMNLQVVSTATERHGASRMQTSTVRWMISDCSAAARVPSALNSRPARPAPTTDRVLSATALTSAARCRQWTATTTPTCAVKPARPTIPALKVVQVSVTIAMFLLTLCSPKWQADQDFKSCVFAFLFFIMNARIYLVFCYVVAEP